MTRAPCVALGVPLSSVAAAAAADSNIPVSVAALVAAAPPGAKHVAAAHAHRAAVALSTDATPRDTLRAFCHGLLLAGACGDELADPCAAAAVLEAGWERFEGALTRGGWDVDAPALVPQGARFVVLQGGKDE